MLWRGKNQIPRTKFQSPFGAWFLVLGIFPVGLRWAGLFVVLMLLLAGCNSQKQPVYQGKQGFRFTAPPGWVERARDDALPARVGHGRRNVPLPPLGVPGKAAREQLLVRYDRLAPGKLAWLRVTVADLPSSMPLKGCLSTRTPGPNWKRESEEESLEVSGLPAARIVFAGRWDEQDYLCETVAVRKEEKVYLITASFPTSDGTAREAVRQAVAGATWQ
jgi:hypothetical protein